MDVQLTEVRYSSGGVGDYKKNGGESAYQDKGSVMVSGCLGDGKDNEKLKWKDLDNLKMIPGNCSVYIMNEKDRTDQKINFGGSFEGFPTMTLLTMILVNARVLSPEASVNNGEELINSLSKYRDNWEKKKEQYQKGVWLIVKGGGNNLNTDVFKDSRVDIFEGDAFETNVTSRNLAGINWEQLQKNLKTGTPTGNSPMIKFKNTQSSGHSGLAYIDFNSETS